MVFRIYVLSSEFAYFNFTLFLCPIRLDICSASLELSETKARGVQVGRVGGRFSMWNALHVL